MNNNGNPPREVTCAIIVNDKKILAVQKALPSKNAHKWEFAGGKLEQDETLEQCLRREIKEELNLDIVTLKLVGDNLIVNGKYHLHTFLARVSEVNAISLSEHEAYKWLTKNEILKQDWLDSDREWANWVLANWESVTAFESL